MIDLIKVRNYYIAGRTDLRLGIDGLAAGSTGSRHCAGAVMGISCCIYGCPIDDFNGPSRKWSVGFCSHRTFADSWES